MDTSSGQPTGHHGTILAPPIAEFETMRVIHTVEAGGYSIPKDTSGTIVAIHDRGMAYAVEIADLPGGPEVVTLCADQIERVR
jgi:hypothetical protein